MLALSPHRELVIIIYLPVYMVFLVIEGIVMKILVTLAKNDLSRSSFSYGPKPISWTKSQKIGTPITKIIGSVKTQRLQMTSFCVYTNIFCVAYG